MSLIDFFTKEEIPKEEIDIQVIGTILQEEHKIDEETSNLFKRWEKIEKEIFEDEAIIEVTIKAIKILEEILDQSPNQKVKKWQDYLKELYGKEKWLEQFLHLKTKKDEQHLEKLKNIFGVHALQEHGRILLFRSSFLYRFLEKTGSGKDIEKLKRIVEILEKYTHVGKDITKTSVFKKYPNMIKNAIDLFLKILERNKEYLIQNKNKIIEDVNYEYSLINIIIHEISHDIWTHSFDNSTNIYVFKQGINESWAHTLQLFSHLYNKEDNMDEKLLNKEINKLLSVIKDKSIVIAYTVEKSNLSKHIFMQSFMCLFGALILINIILKEKKENIDKEITKAFDSGNIHNIYLITMKSLDKIKDDKLKNIIHKRLITKSLDINKKITRKIIKTSNQQINSINRQWNSIKDYLEHFLEFLNSLLLLDPENQEKIDELKLKMEKKLEKVVKKYFSNVKGELKSLVKDETEYIEKLKMMFKDEEETLQFLRTEIE